VVWHVAHIDICWGGDIAFLRCRASSLMDSDSFGGGGRAPRTVAQAGASRTLFYKLIFTVHLGGEWVKESSDRLRIDIT